MTNPLPAQVRSARAELSALLAATDADQASRLTLTQRAGGSVPTVVVIGETNRGKSCLVNALLGTPDLSPVDAGTATATYLVLEYGAE